MSPKRSDRPMMRRRRSSGKASASKGSAGARDPDSEDGAEQVPVPSDEDEATLEGTQIIGQEMVVASQALVPVSDALKMMDHSEVKDDEEAAGDEGDEDFDVTAAPSGGPVVLGDSEKPEGDAVETLKSPQNPPAPKGTPKSYGPLFTPEQIKKYNDEEPPSAVLKFREGGRRPPEVAEFPHLPPGWWHGMEQASRHRMDEQWKASIRQEVDQMGAMLRAAHFENEKLRLELVNMKENRTPFVTPEDERNKEEDGAVAQQVKKPGESSMMRKNLYSRRTEPELSKIVEECRREEQVMMKKERLQDVGRRTRQQPGRRSSRRMGPEPGKVPSETRNQE